MIAHFTTVHISTDTRIYYRQIRTLAEHYPELYYFCTDKPSVSVGENVHVKLLPIYSNKFLRLFFSWFACLRALLKTKGIKVVQFHDPELIFFGVGAKIFGYKVIYDKHEDVRKQIYTKPWMSNATKHIISGIYHGLEQFLTLFFDVVITVTPQIKEKLSHRNVRLVRNFPIRNELYDPNANPISERQPVLFYVGDASVERGLNSIVYGFANSTKAKKLVIVGRVSSEGYFERHVHPRKDQTIELLGQQDRSVVRQQINEAMVGIVMIPNIPSFRVAYPNKVFEYMSAGLPIVASNLPNLKRFIEDEKAGLCVDPDNYEAIGRAIDQIMENGESANSMSENGRQLVEETYSWEAEIPEFLSIYRELLADEETA